MADANIVARNFIAPSPKPGSILSVAVDLTRPGRSKPHRIREAQGVQREDRTGDKNRKRTACE